LSFEMSQMRITPQDVASLFFQFGFRNFFGVPDSTIQPIMSALEQTETQILASAHESQALGEATGFHIANGKNPVVYLQNSGLGNLVNPLCSLANENVFPIPALLLIGWRYSFGDKDEPQHRTMGDITPRLLELLNIQWLILPETRESLEVSFQERILPQLRSGNRFAILVPHTFFKEKDSQKLRGTDHATEKPLRIDVIRWVLSHLDENDVIVSTTGKTSREVALLRESGEFPETRDIRNVGAMGLASSIGLGLAQARPNKRVIILDGDGALLMHFGSMPTIAARRPKNLLHICFSNRVHDSTGGQPLSAPALDPVRMAHELNYAHSTWVETREDLILQINNSRTSNGPHFIGIEIAPGSSEKLGRPTETPMQNLNRIQKFLEINRQ
jgi:phosphonopyruvate decarboxylase